MRDRGSWVWLAVGVLACNASPDVEVCVRGGALACVCTDGAIGVTTCRADGTGFEECRCGGG